MLMKTEVPETLKNLIHLRDVTFPVVEEKDEQGLVVFEFFWCCKSFGCLLGWDYHLLCGGNFNDIVGATEWTYKRYGITTEEHANLFGIPYGTLKQRKTYLCNLIESRYAELGIEEMKVAA